MSERPLRIVLADDAILLREASAITIVSLGKIRCPTGLEFLWLRMVQCPW